MDAVLEFFLVVTVELTFEFGLFSFYVRVKCFCLLVEYSLEVRVTSDS